MKIRKSLQNLKSLDQLNAYLDAGNGVASGSFNILEIEDDGGEYESSIPGSYRRADDPETHRPSIVFEPRESDPSFGYPITVSDKALALGAVTVLSRKHL